VSPGTIALIVIALSVAAWGLFMGGLTIKRSRRARAEPNGDAAAVAASARESEASEPAPAKEAPPAKPPAKKKPLTPEQLAVSRRQFMNRAATASFTAFLGFFGLGTLSFLWPKLTGGFGTEITAGDYEELLATVGPPGNIPLFVAEGRFWLTYYDGSGDAPVYVATNWSKDMKLIALYRKCVHLGCSVPHCDKSSLFECPCHGSKYRLSGEYYSGPAPRGLDRFPITVQSGKVVVDTGSVQTGPPRGTNTWPEYSEPKGPFCVPV
jgi:cytochrome b6-f complex iron-sulfur subunit